MFAPFLLVGLGGSGGKTLRTVRDELGRRLAQVGWDEPFPNAWQFIHIDVPTVPDGDDPDLPPQLPAGNYRGLVKPGITYKTVDNALWQKAEKSAEARDALAGWRPKAIEVNVPVDKGAGQYRALGRFITVASLASVKEAVQQSFSRLHDASVPGELGRLSVKFGDTASSINHEPVVIIVASIAGGSGAGMLMDVSDVVRSIGGNAGDHSIGLLYAPDVFDEIPAEQRKGVRPNALASLGDLLAGYWATDGIGAGEGALYELSGVPVAAARRSGPHYPILVGRKNSKVSFGDQNDVYRAMGRALSSWMTDYVIQDSFRAYTITNWANNAENVPDNMPLKLVTQATPFAAVGFARVGLGRDRFRQYAGEALSRRSVEWILKRHEHIRADRNDDRPESALVEELADHNFAQFIAACGLAERTEAANDVLDALQPSDFDARLGQASGAALAAAVQGLPAAQWDVWRVRVRQQLEARVKVTADELRNESLQLGRAWVSTIQAQVSREVAASVAKNGLPVTLALLDRVEEDLRAALVELPQEAERFQRWAEQAQMEAVSVGADKGKAEIPAGHPDLKEAVYRGYREAEHLAQVEMRRIAVLLIRDLLTHLLAPLRTQMITALHHLSQDATKAQDGRPARVQTWPSGRDVPQRLRPSLNEVLLDSPDAYPDELDSLVRRTLNAADPGSAIIAAMHQIITGAFDNRDQTMISVSTGWKPVDSMLHTSAMDSESKASFDISVGPADILRRADEWISRPGTPIGDHVNEMLAGYLVSSKVDAAELSRRMLAFESSLGAAIDLADPLVEISAAVMSVVHGKSEHATTRIFSGIPFAQSHPGRARAKAVLHSKGMLDEAISRVFVDDDKEFVDIFTTLAEPYEAVVFDSLMKPIAEEWSMKNSTADGRATFWRWRRARPLAQALPLSRPVRHAMVRGWFTAQVLGQLRQAGESWEIFVPNPGGAPGTWEPFPAPLLMVQVTQAHESLPAVLKSIGLAMLEVNASGSLAAVAPYQRLRDLGSSGSAKGVEVYNRANPELESWILSGTLPAGAPTPVEQYAGSPAADAQGRTAAIGERWRKQEETYQRLFADTNKRSNFFDVPQAWELRADIETAFDDLRLAVDGALRLGQDAENF